MKYRLRYLVSGLLITTTLVATPVALAESNSNSSSNTSNSSTSVSSDSSSSSSSSTTTVTSTNNDDTIKIETEHHTMADRLALLKAKFKIQLTVAQTTRLKLRCVAAQGVIAQLNTRFGNSVAVRTSAYTELQSRLSKLVITLKTHNVDTATLESQITSLNTKVTSYNTDLAAYKQTLSDLKAVDCKADPTGFQSALQAARAAHDKLVTDVTDIRTYLKDTIKVTLQSILKTLESSSTTNTTTNTTSGGTQ